MEIEVTGTPEVPATPTTENLTPATPTDAPAPEAPESLGAGDAGGEPEVPAYVPNFGYKVHEIAKEIPEWARPLIKSKEDETRVREIFEKADGLEHVKPKLERLREEHQAVTKQVENYDNVKAHLETDLRNNDFDSFFHRLGIPEKMVMTWVAEKLRYNELPPADKERYDENMRLRRDNAALTRKAGSSDQQATQAETNRLNFELDTALSSPEVAAVMREYDSRQGQNAFRALVVEQAVAKEMSTGKRITPKEAVTNLLTLMGRLPGSNPAQPTNPPSQGGVIAQTGKPPIIPNLKSRGGTPVKKKPTSFEELRKQNAERLKDISG